MQGKPCAAAASQHDEQPATETLAPSSEGTFKVNFADDGGTGKVSGVDLMAWGQSNPAETSNLGAAAESAGDGSHNKAAVTKQMQEEAHEEGVNAVCECSDGEEGICEGISKDDPSLGFHLHVTHAVVPSGSTGVLHDSSAAGLVMDGSESDGELQPAEEAVVTHRDILLHAAQRRKHESADSDCFTSNAGLSFSTDSQKVGITIQI